MKSILFLLAIGQIIIDIPPNTPFRVVVEVRNSSVPPVPVPPVPVPPVPVPPIPVPPIPVPPTSPIYEATRNLTKNIDYTQRMEFANNFTSVAAQIDAQAIPTKMEAEIALKLRNRESIAKYPSWTKVLDPLTVEINKIKDKITTTKELSELYKEIARGLSS
jgi:hypothetical protein